MRKSFLIIAAAAMLASCWENEKIGKDIVNDENPTVIGFNTFSDKATRATEVENLEKYHGTFNVYATKISNNPDADKTPVVVFDGDDEADIITYVAGKMDPNNWTYSPYRYWDKQATYAFIAVAPNSNIIKYSKPDNVADAAGTFATTAAGYTLVGQNLQTAENPGTIEAKVGFNGVDGNDTDLMTSGRISRNGAATIEDVVLEFKHILAKLNIAIAKDPQFDNVSVIIRKVQVLGLDNKGSYNEGTSTINSSWSNTEKVGDYKLLWENANGVELLKGEGEGDNYKPGEKLYFIESLVMPQSIEQNVEKLIIDYTIVTETREENYNYELKFDDGENKVFENFADHNNYTINLTVRPNIITFDATATVWEDKTGESVIPAIVNP